MYSIFEIMERYDQTEVEGTDIIIGRCSQEGETPEEKESFVSDQLRMFCVSNGFAVEEVLQNSAESNDAKLAKDVADEGKKGAFIVSEAA